MSVKGSRCEAAFFLLIFFKNLLTFKKYALYFYKNKKQKIIAYITFLSYEIFLFLNTQLFIKTLINIVKKIANNMNLQTFSFINISILKYVNFC